MSILEMKVPSPGESITEVEISSWLVKDGDFVEKDQPIAEVDSDKATLELPAEQSGVITLKAEEGDVVKVGQVVCLIDMSAQGAAAKTEKPASEMKVETQAVAAPVQEPKKEEDLEVLDRKVEDLEFSKRPMNCLKIKEIKTVRDLISYTKEEVKKFKNLGAKSLEEIVNKVEELGLEFKKEEK